MDPSMLSVEVMEPEWAPIPQLLSQLTVAFQHLHADNARLRAQLADAGARETNEWYRRVSEKSSGRCSEASYSSEKDPPCSPSTASQKPPCSPPNASQKPPGELLAVVSNKPPYSSQKDQTCSPPNSQKPSGGPFAALSVLPPAQPPKSASLPTDLQPRGAKKGRSLGEIGSDLRNASTLCLSTDEGEASSLKPQCSEAGMGQLREAWEQTRQADLVASAFARMGRAVCRSSPSNKLVSRTGDVVRSDGFLQCLTRHPRSRFNLFWDFCSILVLTADVMLTPMVAFGVNTYEDRPGLHKAGAMFWTIDMVHQCFVGYYAKGIIEMRPAMIIRRYLRKSFVLDFIVVSVDWALIFASQSGSTARLFRLNKGMRVFRLVRIFRLLRVVKLVIVFSALDTSFAASNVVAFFRITRNVLCIVAINHFVACGWYAISVFSSKLGYRSWESELLSDVPGENTTSFYYDYTTSLHWALTQFTPASMEVFPTNPIERVFTICVMLCSLLAFSSVVASMTAIMSQTMAENSNHVTRMELLKRYISEHRVSVDLRTRIYAYIARERRRHLDANPLLECQVPALTSLPANLQEDLHNEVHMNVLVRHPLFALLRESDHNGMLLVIKHAMTEEFHKVGGRIWADDEFATTMRFVLRGDFHLFASGSNSTEWESVELSPHATSGDILSEEALWLHWKHSGTLYSISDAEMLTLSSAKFASIMHGGPALPLLFIYANLFHDYAHKLGLGIQCDLTEIRPLVARAKMQSGGRTKSSSMLLSKTTEFIQSGRSGRSWTAWANRISGRSKPTEAHL